MQKYIYFVSQYILGVWKNCWKHKPWYKYTLHAFDVRKYKSIEK